MRMHVLGICGTFMGGIAALARELGHEVEGSDANVYPPMSTQLEQLGIVLKSGYSAEHLQDAPDLVVIGNALSRGNPAIEHLLDVRMPYVSGPQWLGDTVLSKRHVLAVAGTHGKTTTTGMLAFILDACGRAPGFLVGGVPLNFEVSARLGRGTDFVIEADEYDTAFFDKRSKFVHYHPSIAILNNLEFDHADIFPDVAAIQRQFHHLVRTVPRNGRLIVNAEDARLAEVIAQGCWSPITSFGMQQGEWQARAIEADGSVFDVLVGDVIRGRVRWELSGRHNMMNALAALAAADAAGVDIPMAIAALRDFRNAKRRMEVVGDVDDIRVYDDFAHHPTAIATTLAGLRARVGDARIVIALEPRSNSMRLGAHAEELAPSLRAADAVLLLHRPSLPWDADRVIAGLAGRGQAAATVDELLDLAAAQVNSGDHIVFMSNGGFEGAPHRFVERLRGRGH